VAARPRTRALVLAAVVLALVAAAAGSATAAPRPAAPGLRTQIQQLVESTRVTNAAVGMAVAVVMPKTHGNGTQVEVVTSGHPTSGRNQPVNRRTQFEMGSESKSFTAGLLAHLVATQQVSLDDPLQKYAPAGVAIPAWHENGVETPITLRNLAAHQSGLPDEPANLNAGCPGQKACPEAKQNYTETMLWDGIQHERLLWKPGTNWLYSNDAFGLLGTVLANRLFPGQEPPAYRAALDTSFLDALAMSSTELERPTPKLATPYGGNGRAVPYWNNVNALAGGGGLVSDVADMATWVAANLGYVGRRPAPGVASLPDAVRPISTIIRTCSSATSCEPADFHMGMAWQLYSAGHGGIDVGWAFKNGGTAGMHSVTVLAPSEGVGVTLLSTGGTTSPDPLGPEILKLVLAARTVG
jgi:D-alanyl-D-alanine-carboxypeptidase/D-alanyl-D-alanine-endopeptidase